MTFHPGKEFPPSVHHDLDGLYIQEIDETGLAHASGGRYLLVLINRSGSQYHHLDHGVRSEFFHSLGD